MIRFIRGLFTISFNFPKNNCLKGFILDLQNLIISTNLKSLVFEITEIAPSIRTALAKTALECLQKLIDHFDFTPFFESIVNQLLKLLLSSKAFIAKLSHDCISSILRSINRKKAFEFLAKNHKSKPGPCKAQLSASLLEIIESCEDPVPLLTTLGCFLTDANPEVRDHAKISVITLGVNFPNLNDTINAMEIDLSEKNALLFYLNYFNQS